MRRIGGDVSAALARGLSWWTGELASLVPGHWRAAGGPGKADLTVLIRDGAMSGTVPVAAGLTDEQSILDEVERRSRRGAVRVVMRLPLAECFVRSVTVPKAAVPDLARIASLELERTTPFRRGDVYSAILVGETGRGRGSVTAEHIVVKRAKLSALQGRLERAGAVISGVDCYRSDPTQALAVDFLRDSNEALDDRRTSSFFSSGRLAIGAGALALAALVITTVRHERALLTLKEETAAVRARVVAARSNGAESEEAPHSAYAQLKGAYPPVVEILDELTRRLPDSAYVTQLRLADGAIELGGYGRPVRTLAPEFEKSPFVVSASITAPIVTDEKLQKERFDLRLQLAKRAAGADASPAAETAP